MPTPRQQTREQELKAAIDGASLSPRDLAVLRNLFKRANWVTAIIPDRWQPRSIEDLAGHDLSPRSVQRALDHLVQHEWVSRHRRQSPGRQGPGIAYGVHVGEDCRCKPERPVPMTNAERQRRWREKQRQIGVTETGISRQIGVTYNATDPLLSAGQEPVVTERASRGEQVMREYLGGAVVWETGWPTDPVGDEVDEAGWSA